MNLVETLKKGLDRTAVYDYTPNSKVVLTEQQNGMTVEVGTGNWQVTAIAVPANSWPPVITGMDWRLLCDYFLVCRRREEVQVLLVELKRTLSPPRDEKAMEQLRRSLPLWRYLQSAASVDSRSEIVDANPVRYAAIYLEEDERFAKEETTGSSGRRTREWRGIRVREVVATSVRLSELVDSPPDDAEPAP